jgi:hypothetical protein
MWIGDLSLSWHYQFNHKFSSDLEFDSPHLKRFYYTFVVVVVGVGGGGGLSRLIVLQFRMTRSYLSDLPISGGTSIR